MLILQVDMLEVTRPWFSGPVAAVVELLHFAWARNEKPYVDGPRLSFIGSHQVRVTATHEHSTCICQNTQDLSFACKDGHLADTTWVGDEALFILANAGTIFGTLTGPVRSLVFDVPVIRGRGLPCHYEDF